MARSSQRNRPEDRNNRKARRVNKTSGYGSYEKAIPSKLQEVKPLNERQRLMTSSITANDVTFATGSAGTGKTYIAIAEGCRRVLKESDYRLILTKPDFEIDERLGILPGDENDKTAIIKRSMTEIIIELIGKSHYENLSRSERIQFQPLGSILGLTFKNAFVVIDEAQNTTIGQMKALLTRSGFNSKFVVCGDFKEQKYIEGRCGLEDAVSRFRGVQGVGRIDFKVEDIVRDGFCKRAVIAYRDNPDDEE